MARIELDAYEDDDRSDKDPRTAKANGHMEIYLRLDGKEHLLHVDTDADGTLLVYWDGGDWNDNGDPTQAEEDE
jgi:hypothetical protein